MVPGEPSRRRSGRSHEAFGDGRPRGMAITASGRLRQKAGQNPAYTPSGTDPGPENRSVRGRFGGSSRDKCAFQGTSLWIANFVVAGRNRSASVADCVVETQGFAALAR
jgi:hypothetical protein